MRSNATRKGRLAISANPQQVTCAGAPASGQFDLSQFMEGKAKAEGDSRSRSITVITYSGMPSSNLFMSAKTNPDKFLSFAEVAELIGISVDSLCRCECGTDTLARIKLGRRTVFSFNNVQNWMAQKVRETQEAQAKSQMAKQDLLDKQAQSLSDKQWTKKTYLEIVGGLKR